VAAKPTQQLPVAATVSRELTVAKQPPLLVEHGSVMSATMGVDPADDNPAVVRHAGWPFRSTTGQDRHAPAGGRTHQ
jgi:hypothetical protein